MSKRRTSSGSPAEADSIVFRPKRIRLSRNFYSLSDELILKVVSFLTPSDLTRCQQVCRRLFRIAGDEQVWKSAFYDRFVRPRALRLPGLGRAGSHTLLPAYSARSSKWLDDEGFSKARDLNWKQLYKLRHNWSRGSCGVSEIGISSAPYEPPVCIQMRMGIVFTLDTSQGLQAWRVEGDQNFIARKDLSSTDMRSDLSLGLPTALALDETENPASEDVINITVGFDTGGFAVYQLNLHIPAIFLKYAHSNRGPRSSIIAMAYSGSHLATMNNLKRYTLYHFGQVSETHEGTESVGAPAVVTSLQSHTMWAPVRLSLRQSVHGVFASLVYTVPTFDRGWSIAIQELRLNTEGTSIQKSRISSSIHPWFYPVIPFMRTNNNESTALPIGSLVAPPTGTRIYPDMLTPTTLSRPLSLSYSHPYLLVAHNDNTITPYLVKSTTSSLEINIGHRLWGHTSALSGAHVGSRGRAVSMSERGFDLRVWNLEGCLPANRKVRECVKVYPSSPRGSSSANSDSSSPNWQNGAALNRWFGFDEEKVVVHKEDETGKQVLIVYDFS